MPHYTALGIVTAILFGLLPFATSRHLFHAAVNTKYFLVIFFVLVLTGIAAFAYFEGKRAISLQGIKQRPLLWAGVALFAVYSLSALVGVFPERSFFSDIQRSSGVFFLTHIAVLAFLLGEFLNERDWRLIRRTVVISAGLFGLLSLIGVEGFGVHARILWTNLAINGYTFGNTTFAGVYLVISFIVALIELSKTPRGTRWFYILSGSSVFIFLSPILFNTGLLWGQPALAELAANPELLLGSARASSATLFMLIIYFGGYLLLRRFRAAWQGRAIALWSSAFVLAAAAGVAMLFTPGSVVQEKYIEVSSAARIVVWDSAFYAITARPLLGWGPENVEQALQGYFDNRLFEREYLGEIWFDRAHNVIVDTLVQVGVVGSIAYVVVIGAFVLVVYRARKRQLVDEPEMILLCALPLAHFLQLQTGFDTIATYALLGVVGGYALWLERKMLVPTEKEERRERERSRLYAKYYKAGAAVAGILILVSASYTYTELNRQYSLYRAFVEPSAVERMVYIENATSRLSSFESLRFSSASFLKGTLEHIAERGQLTPGARQDVYAQIDFYEVRYRRYIEAQPNYYRVRMNYAYLLSVERVLGGSDNLTGAKEILMPAYELSPGNPLTPATEALLELYSGNIKLARQKAEVAVEANPNAAFSREVLDHIKKQENTFPRITVLRLENI